MVILYECCALQTVLSRVATTERARSGILHRKKNYTRWKDIGMLSMLLLTTIHLGKQEFVRL
jgi:hypothetical protein